LETLTADAGKAISTLSLSCSDCRKAPLRTASHPGTETFSARSIAIDARAWYEKEKTAAESQALMPRRLTGVGGWRAARQKENRSLADQHVPSTNLETSKPADRSSAFAPVL